MPSFSYFNFCCSMQRYLLIYHTIAQQNFKLFQTFAIGQRHKLPILVSTKRVFKWVIGKLFQPSRNVFLIIFAVEEELMMKKKQKQVIGLNYSKTLMMAVREFKRVCMKKELELAIGRNANHEIKLKFTGKYNKGLRTSKNQQSGGGIYDDHGKKKINGLIFMNLKTLFLGVATMIQMVSNLVNGMTLMKDFKKKNMNLVLYWVKKHQLIAQGCTRQSSNGKANI